VYVGAYKSRSTGYGAERRTGKRQVTHPKFRRKNNENDFMIVLLNKPSRKKRVQLSLSNQYPRGRLSVVGMGSLSQKTKSGSSFLRKAAVQSISLQKCKSQHRRSSKQVDGKSMVCAGGNSRQDACYGKYAQKERKSLSMIPCLRGGSLLFWGVCVLLVVSFLTSFSFALRFCASLHTYDT